MKAWTQIYNNRAVWYDDCGKVIKDGYYIITSRLHWIPDLEYMFVDLADAEKCADKFNQAEPDSKYFPMWIKR